MTTQPIMFPDKIRREYQAVMAEYIKRMKSELMSKLPKAYARRAKEFLSPGVAGDESASVYLGTFIDSFFKRWQKIFDRMADKRATWFKNQTEKAGTDQVKKMLKDIGFTVEFKNSHYVNNILQATYAENVDLISSIPKNMHDKVRGIVMRGVQSGNDQHYIATELQKQFGMTERRARFIARDQTQKANSAISMARSDEAGIEYGFWMHRSGSKRPRPHHQAMNKKRFKLSEGLYDIKVKRKVKPGEEPGCLCAFRPDLSSYNPKLAQSGVVFRFTGTKEEANAITRRAA